MGDKKLYLGEFEEIVLLAVMRLRGEGYGVSIRQTVEEVAERPTAIGAIYTTLERLEEKGLVKSRLGEATAERGGRAKKHFAITGTGVEALQEADRIRARLRDGLRPAGGVA